MGWKDGPINSQCHLESAFICQSIPDTCPLNVMHCRCCQLHSLYPGFLVGMRISTTDAVRNYARTTETLSAAAHQLYPHQSNRSHLREAKTFSTIIWFPLPLLPATKALCGRPYGALVQSKYTAETLPAAL
ncbi:hypothetical protein PCH_Pc21g10760 [Penicillium rubens Wisconsin 54-1255]|uniref:Uncharacterized protein n=1 Tax=Penicillium rubens (strain ATCC 28089 / DSM 1075 / NRRL 1951 / Wisconsin 54-1255) TaxID=500485 RepID=B6HJD9_PENRW|nr:hypothetical protein PCH_Pc21g10760 [Penicillium rubens Wisconsin 54-1255]